MELSSSPPPLAPPTTEEDKLSWLRLLRSRRVGPATFLRLMKEHGAASAALDALPGVAAQAGETGYRICPEGVVHAEMRAGRKAGARLLFLGSTDYPPLLAMLTDPPPILWAIGAPELARRPTVSVIGARSASSLGTRMARALAQGLGGAGATVVSGMARGIDAAAHAAALETGTVAVLAGGVDHVYPQENATLYHEIAARGLIVSERPPGTVAQARDFPRRNRLISGLSLGVVVIEAALRSGSLGTARLALDQGREVMAVPGHPMEPRAAGCNALIRDGAVLVREAADVIAALPPMTLAPMTSAPAPSTRPVKSAPAAPPPPSAHASDTLQTRVMNSLGDAPLSRDQIARDLQVPVAQLEQALAMLELDGALERGPGGLIHRRL